MVVLTSVFGLLLKHLLKEKVVIVLLCKHYNILGYLFSKQACAYGI